MYGMYFITFFPKMLENIFTPKCNMQMAKQKTCTHSLTNSYKAKTVYKHCMPAVTTRPGKNLTKLTYSSWQSANDMPGTVLCASFNTLASFAC